MEANRASRAADEHGKEQGRPRPSLLGRADHQDDDECGCIRLDNGECGCIEDRLARGERPL